MFEEIFSRKKLVDKKLLQYGFQNINGVYKYSSEILSGSFVLIVTFDKSGNLDTSLTEKDSGEEYSLYKTAAQGSFVGEIRAAISSVLEDISGKCFEISVFKQEQTLRLIDFAADKFESKLEFLWQKYDDYAVLRRKDTNKWYGIIMTIPKKKLGIDSSEVVEILDLRAQQDKMCELLSQQGFYPGWHMNKKSWFTVILDGSVSDEKLFELVQESYNLAK